MTYRTRNIAIAVGLAVLAMVLTLLYTLNYRSSVQSAQATVQVYVAKHNIPTGTSGTDLVKSHDLTTASVPRHAVVPGAISSPNQVANLVVTQPLYAGEQVTLRRFADTSAEGIAGQLRGSMRAVQVAGDANQLLAGTLQTGDHIDVVANLQTGTSTNVHVTRIVLRNVVVLSAPDMSTLPTTGSTTEMSAILAVSDTQVQRLFFVLKNADWTLELRPAADATDSPERLDGLGSILTAGVK
jgi:Flp pilus assembly protein CpaB